MRRFTFFGVVERSSGPPRCQFLVRWEKTMAPASTEVAMTR